MLSPTYQPEFNTLKDLLIKISQERSIEVLLVKIVEHMAARPHVALARIWLLNDGDNCDTCANRSICPNQKTCLHLAAERFSAHIDATPPKVAPDLTVQRIPVGHEGIGTVAAAGKALRENGLEADSRWRSRNPWAKNIVTVNLGIQPLLHKDETLGVIAIYSMIDQTRLREGRFWLQMIAHIAAFTIANTRAFEQIEKLKAQLELENAYLREEIKEVQAFGDIIGQSPPLLNILNQVELVAPTDATVLILGESGTGKELIAREIHQRSKRSHRPMIRVNCATIPGDLYESEFFGHVKGAFTGAVKDRSGRFQAGDGGTLFLDEVGEIPINLQSKLLRVLQEGAYERIGEDITRKVDVRIIAATNRNLKGEVDSRRFREDLYYRLNVFPITIAPLRRRKQDIVTLARHFLKIVAGKMNRSVPELTRNHIRELSEYRWPGNVRELQNAVERAVIRSRSGCLSFDLPKDRALLSDPVFTDQNITENRIFTDAELNTKIRENIIAALKKSGGKIYGPGGAAKLLGVKPTTLCSRIQRMGLSRLRPSHFPRAYRPCQTGGLFSKKA